MTLLAHCTTPTLRLEQNVSYSGQSSLRRSGKNALHTQTHMYTCAAAYGALSLSIKIMNT